MVIKEHQQEPHVPLMKLCMQKVQLHVSDLLFRLLFFHSHFASTFMQEQIHNLCDHLLLPSVLSVMDVNGIAESSCDCTAIVRANHNATGNQISPASKMRSCLITVQLSAVSQNQNLIKYLWSCSLQVFAYRREKRHMLFL